MVGDLGQCRRPSPSTIRSWNGSRATIAVAPAPLTITSRWVIETAARLAAANTSTITGVTAANSRTRRMWRS
jgi:hypothetical protein